MAALALGRAQRAGADGCGRHIGPTNLGLRLTSVFDDARAQYGLAAGQGGVVVSGVSAAFGDGFDASQVALGLLQNWGRRHFAPDLASEPRCLLPRLRCSKQPFRFRPIHAVALRPF
jgi:hypothetical protein